MMQKQSKEVVKQILGPEDPTYYPLIWGWLRLFLGVLQISLSVAGITALFKIGFQPLTWALVAGSSFATLSSLILYRARSPIEGKENRMNTLK